MSFVSTSYPSPVGVLTIIASDEGLRALTWPDDMDRVSLPAHVADRTHPILREAVNQLDQYFEHRRVRFDLPLDPVGTRFQQAVWARLQAVPYGETLSYGALAMAIGHPGAARAVGAANGKNPISIIVPCHRVIASSGALTGYAGGLEVKRALLAHEAGQSSSVTSTITSERPLREISGT